MDNEATDLVTLSLRKQVTTDDDHLVAHTPEVLSTSPQRAHRAPLSWLPYQKHHVYRCRLSRTHVPPVVDKDAKHGMKPQHIWQGGVRG
ncbi:hypothetical protein LSAT2_012520 [Lamellibrachia satsuma]|nr:hypothetical protein LSAT2_012520 [Lamellibrachia satsuma]